LDGRAFPHPTSDHAPPTPPSPCSSSCRPAAAAQVAPATTPTFGILAGYNSATLDGENFFDEGSATQSRRNGFTGGLYLTLPLGASGLAFRPEVLYSQKGVRYASTFQAPPSTGVPSSLAARADVRLSYVEAPLLLQYTVPTSGGLRPQLYAGVAPASGRRARWESACGPRHHVQRAQRLRRPRRTARGDTPAFRRFDVGGVVGGAVAFGVGGRALTVGVRYTHGFLTLTDDGDSPKNRAIGVYGSIECRWPADAAELLRRARTAARRAHAYARRPGRRYRRTAGAELAAAGRPAARRGRTRGARRRPAAATGNGASPAGARGGHEVRVSPSSSWARRGAARSVMRARWPSSRWICAATASSRTE
jgi:hypothetical protein